MILGFCGHRGLYEFIVSAPALLCFPLALATVVSYSDHKQENKAAISAVHDEARLWRIRVVLATEKSAGYKGSLAGFVDAEQLPIKMKMSARLRLRLSKQMKK